MRKKQAVNPDLVAELVNALKQVDPMAKTLMDELGNRKATDWRIVNDCLCAVATALSHYKQSLFTFKDE